MRLSMGPLGMGEFVPARFPIPQNPVAVGMNGMGEFVPACFPIPQNPVGMSGLGSCGGGCGCGGKCGVGMEGLAGVVEDITGSISGAFNDLTSSFGGGDMKTYLMVGGAVVLGYVLLSRGGGHRSEQAALRAEYKSKSAALRASSGRGYKRIGKAARAGYAAF